MLWRFAVERHSIYLRRLAAEPAPWTEDPVLAEFRFTNPFRAADRVSQYLIGLVEDPQTASAEDLLLRVLLFKIFNKIETWEAVVDAVGPQRASSFTPSRVLSALADLRAEGRSIYSPAYIIPPVPGARDKAAGHIALLKHMLDSGLGCKVAEAPSFEAVYRLLLECPGIGQFLAYQYATDLNYSPLLGHSEMEFVVPGPGALDGLSKCFSSLGDFQPSDVIRWMTDRQTEEFRRLQLSFGGLWGRSLQLIDVQNLLCEVSKYTRVSHPQIRGRLGRSRIKQRFTPAAPLPRPRFPARWGLETHISTWFGARHGNQCLAVRAISGGAT